jgi:AbrB family looped-hinge helix DNA binding protein
LNNQINQNILNTCSSFPKLSENMTKGLKKEKCCPPSRAEDLKVEAIVSIDERGQMVLPKEIRARAGLQPGDKLAVVTRERDGKVCCIYMFKTDELLGMVKDRMGPLLQDITAPR